MKYPHTAHASTSCVSSFFGRVLPRCFQVANVPVLFGTNANEGALCGAVCCPPSPPHSRCSGVRWADGLCSCACVDPWHEFSRSGLVFRERVAAQLSGTLFSKCPTDLPASEWPAWAANRCGFSPHARPGPWEGTVHSRPPVGAFITRVVTLPQRRCCLPRVVVRVRWRAI